VHADDSKAPDVVAAGDVAGVAVVAVAVAAAAVGVTKVAHAGTDVDARKHVAARAASLMV
jgi:hypothetical protein